MPYLLQAYGHNLFIATEGQTALQLARQQAPDLVICDIQLPGMDGFELARLLRSHLGNKNVPLVAVTALAMVGDRDKVLAAGFDGYIAKPIAPESFVPQIERFLRAEQRSGVSPKPAEIVSDETGMRAQPNSPAAPAGQARGAIHLVDDLAENRQVLASTLKPNGYVILEAAGLSAAMEILRERTPDLVICDFHMPEGDGRNLLQFVKADSALRHVPVLFVSASHLSQAEQESCLSLGAAGFVVQPISPNAMLAQVEACMGGEDSQS